jgi:hypothetical protein
MWELGRLEMACWGDARLFGADFLFDSPMAEAGVSPLINYKRDVVSTETLKQLEACNIL